jgi:hypothetical protein
VLGRTYFAGDVASVDRRLRMLKDIGSLHFNTLDELVGSLVEEGSEDKLAALDPFLQALDEPTYRGAVLEALLALQKVGSMSSTYAALSSSPSLPCVGFPTNGGSHQTLITLIPA